MYLAFETNVMIILGNQLLPNNIDFAGSTGTQHTVSSLGGFISTWDATGVVLQICIVASIRAESLSAAYSWFSRGGEQYLRYLNC